MYQAQRADIHRAYLERLLASGRAYKCFCPKDRLETLREEARAAGLRYVYIGNVPEVPDAGTTFCPGCHRAVIERDIFAVTAFRLTDGKCRFCQTPIAGVWTA